MVASITTALSVREHLSGPGLITEESRSEFNPNRCQNTWKDTAEKDPSLFSEQAG